MSLSFNFFYGIGGFFLPHLTLFRFVFFLVGVIFDDFC